MARPPVKTNPLNGPLTILGLALASLTFGLDQLFKWWMLGPFDIATKGLVTITPFFDLVLAWNRGVSYGWFAQHSDEGQIILVVVSLIITAILWLWLARTNRPLAAAALGLVIGGALGNALDRVVHGAVADFFLLHAYGYSWYVFNIADMAIVAGVGLLLYDSYREGRAS
jgi:signal peptidase II